MTTSKIWIGIDFGTCFSSAARRIPDGVALVPCDSAPNPKTYLVPTVAYITREPTPRILTGYEAETYRLHDPERFFAEFKLEITDPDPLLPDSDITYKDLIAAILADIRQDAIKDNNDYAIDHAVITVPAIYLKDGAQWWIMQDAARKAGFNKVELMYEPQAAAFYYDHIAGSTSPSDLTLVYDLGGGTFDPALIEHSDTNKDHIFGLGAPGGGSVCGGIHFDHLLMGRFLEEYPEFFDPYARDPIKKTTAHFELLAFCRHVKHILSSKNVADLPVPGHGQYHYRINRADFDEMIAPLIEQTFSACDAFLKAHKKDWTELTRVILVGGSCHVPLIRKNLQAYMDKIGAGAVPVVWTTLENQKQIDPMYAVCCGAAISKGGRIMDSKLYEQKRNELIHLLDQVIAIDEIPSQTRENIESIREKCVTNQFEVVLIGEFQGGKSTTFNAICDGREISPRGVNIKTSACRISAQNLADPKAEEYAEIAWRSDQELLLGMINILEPHLKKVQPDRFLKATPDAMVYGGSGMKGQLETLASAGAEKEEIRPLSLRDPEDRNLIGQALDDEWTALKRNKKGYDSDQTGQLDVLRIASIIHLYLEDPFVRQLTEKGRFNIQELSKLVTFPWDWEKRWMNHSATAFSAEEIAFAFIAGVRCHIHSPNLARLGCVITDCPGLFASRWDTLLARQAMLSADAILYLFGGEKAISQGDIHALNEIRLSQQDHKLFYAINVKGNLSNIKNRIRIENASTLTNRGFDLSPEAIHLYNALLGLCARNGHAALSNRLDNLSREQFIKTGRQIDERFSSEFEIHWKQTASMAIRRMDDFSEGVNCLDEVGLQQVVEFSGLDDLVSAIEETVIAKKAQSVLVHQGGAKAKSALMAIEGNLKSQEKAARKTEDEFHLAVLRARDDLELFQKKVTEIIDELSESNLGYPLACEFEDQVIKAHIPEMSEAITDGFADSLWTLKSFFGGITSKFSDKNKEKLENAMKPIIATAIESVCEPIAEGWIQNVYDGISETYNATIAPAVKKACLKIESAWNDIEKITDASDNMSLLEGLGIDTSIETISRNPKLLDAISSNELSKGVKNTSGLSFAANVTGIVTAVIVGLLIAIIGNAILATLTGFIITGGWLPILVLVVGGGAAGLKASDALKRKVREMLLAKVERELRTAFGSQDAADAIRSKSLELVNTIIGGHIDYLKAQIKKQELSFEKRIKSSKKAFELNKSARRKLAEKLLKIRKRIEFVRNGIQEYIKKLDSVFSTVDLNIANDNHPKSTQSEPRAILEASE